MVAARWLFLLRRFFKKNDFTSAYYRLNKWTIVGRHRGTRKCPFHALWTDRLIHWCLKWARKFDCGRMYCFTVASNFFNFSFFFLKKREKIRLFITLISFHVWRPLFHFFKKKFTMKSERCNYFRLQPRCIADNICCRDDVDASAHYFLLTQAALQSFPGILCRLWSVWTTHVTLQADHLSFSFWPVS